MSFLKSFVEFTTSNRRINYRDRRGHYASGNLACLRDQYWSWKGEPETNPTDLVGSMKMLVGNAVEKGVVDAIISNLHFSGYHLVGTQVPVGGSNPDWNGYLDALMARKNEDGTWDRFVIEIKTKSGYGAQLFSQNPTPSPEYMTQLGLYLKDLSEKGITNRGCFLYILMSDRNFGEIITVDCVYEDKSGFITATSFESSTGRSGNLSVKLDVSKALERWTGLNENIRANYPPPKGEYKYKYDLTPELLDNLTDTKLKKIIDGTAVVGDWQPLYSRYKNKQIEVDGISLERTATEIAKARNEYRKRHPRSKI